jgi:hypothetical protein
MKPTLETEVSFIKREFVFAHLINAYVEVAFKRQPS